MSGVIYRLKIETRKLYWLHARYGTFKGRRKYDRRMLRHERRLFKCPPHFLRLFLVTVRKLFFEHYCMIQILVFCVGVKLYFCAVLDIDLLGISFNGAVLYDSYRMFCRSHTAPYNTAS